MSKLILEGGTDVAEMAVFCSDSVPENISNNEIIEKLEAEKKLVRLPTGADGGYLLHLYINENIGENISKYCDKNDIIKKEITISKGNISFGGIESAVHDFKPNKNIRSDAKIPKGVYSATFFKTDYPENLVEDTILESVGENNLKYANLPTYVIAISFFLSILLLVLTFNTNAYYGLILLTYVSAVYYWFKKFTSSKKYIGIEKSIKAVNLEFPNIVAFMEIKKS